MKTFPNSQLTLFLVACLLLGGTHVVPAQTAPSLDQAYTQLRAYDDGQNNAALVIIDQHLARISRDPVQRAQAAQRLAALLGDTQTSLATKRFVCQQLRLFGDNPEIPALARLLDHPATADLARFALEAMPTAAAGKALVEALDRLQGESLLGVINSLGARRETAAVPRLSKLLTTAPPDLAATVLRALGQIGTPEAAAILSRLQPEPARTSALSGARFACAERLLASGAASAAAGLYRSLWAENQPAHIRMGALTGLAKSAPDQALPLILEALRSPDVIMQRHAARVTLHCACPATATLTGELLVLPPSAQAALLLALGERGDREAVGAVEPLVRSSSVSVRAAALEALAQLGTAEHVRLLAESAAREENEPREAARRALRVLAAPEADERLISAARTGPAPVRCEAIDALAARQASSAVPVLLQVAAEGDAAPAGRAWAALGLLAQPRDYPALVALLSATSDASAGDGASQAVIAVGNRIDNTGSRVDPVKAACANARGDAKSALLRVLGAFGGAEALPTVTAALDDADAKVAQTAWTVLTQWPDPSALDELLRLSVAAQKPSQRTLALRAYLRLAGEAKANQPELFRKALEVAKSDAEKLALLGALSGAEQPAALEIAARLVGESGVGREAALAVFSLAAKVGKEQPLLAEASVKKVAQTSRQPDLVEQARQLLREGWTSAEALSPTPYNATAVAASRRKELESKLPPGDRLLAYLDCGVTLRAEGADDTLLRQLNGKGWRFSEGGLSPSPASATIAFDGRQVEFAITGLRASQAYALGFTWWDADGGGRSQSVQLSRPDGGQAEVALPPTDLPSGSARKGPAVIQVPLPASLVSGGGLRAAFRRHSGPNAVVGEAWLLETKPGSSSALRVQQSPGDAASPATAASSPTPPTEADLTPPAADAKVLLVTGVDYPGHLWRQTAPTLRKLLEADSRLKVRIVEDPNALASPKLQEWDVAIIHFMNWEIPGPGPEARENLRRFVAGGKGMLMTHFACGAWYEEWPEFKSLAGRVWFGPNGGRQHDPRGTFTVEIADPAHPITKGMEPFETLDELYTCLTGDAPIHVVAHARSKVDQKYYPMAFVHDYGQGRVFHSVLGHDAIAYTNSPAVGELLRRGCAWAAGLSPTP